MKKTELYILAGFLGSGKTTLLQQLLHVEKSRGRKVGVIMNELGKVSVDSAVVDQNTPLKELLDGCVCCSIQGQFELQLEQLLIEQTLDVIFIETTGIAHPFEVFDACLSPLIADKVDVKGVITIVDLVRFLKREKLPGEMQELLFEQIRFGNILLLNKIDLLTEKEIGELLFQIQSYNTKAKIILTEHAQVNVDEILKNKLIVEKGKHSPVQLGHHLAIQTIVYPFQKPVNYDKFLTFFQQLPDSIIRIKGFVHFQHAHSLYSFQYAWGEPVFLPYDEENKAIIVIIGYDLNETEITRQLESL